MDFQAAPHPHIRASMTDGVGHIVIDRPEKKNAITLAMWRALVEALAGLTGHPALRVIVLRGMGPDFSAGADIAEFETERGNSQSARNYEAANSDAFRAFREAPVPTIAAIDGTCFGGGFGLAAACDLRIATPRSLFSVPAARLGLAYPQDAMIDIVSGLGPQLARYLTFSAARLDAHKAREAGFVLELVEPDALLDRANAMAAAIAANAPLSIKASKASIAACFSNDLAVTEQAKRLGDATFDSVDYAEGRAAFLARRPPRFKGL